MLIENLQRSDLNPMDEANAYQSRMDRFGLTVEELAEWAGVAPFRIQWRLALMNLRPEAQKLVADGALSPGYARLMADLDPDRQALALKALAHDSLTEADMKALCARLLAEQNTQPLFNDSSFLQLEEYVADARGAAAKSSPKAQLARLLTALESERDRLPEAVLGVMGEMAA